ncbi:unnamed protein product [Calicophoron daubneyi]
MTFKEFRGVASSDPNCTPNHRDWEHLERKYWASIGIARPLYGANVSGSLMGSQRVWNIAKLDSILSSVLNAEGVRIPGVNTPYLYYGMWRATFPWHVEDVELYSVNYVHWGQPKHWYVIPPAFARKFEAFVFEYFRSECLSCHCFLRHKCVLINPSVLAKAGIPTRKIVQRSGEFIITFPYAYHAGFNMGLNIAESTNFALPRWIEYGKKAKVCSCWDDTVRICMDPFVRRFQPSLYQAWRKGKDCCPHPLDEYASLDADKSLALAKSAKTTTPETRSLHVTSTAIVRRSHQPKLDGQRAEKKFNFIVGDLNLLDLRYSAEGFLRSRIPYHIVNNPELLPLWCGYPPDLQAEKYFNLLMSNYQPHCAVCCLLWVPQYVAKVLSTEPRETPVPRSGAPHISEVAYAKSDESAFTLSVPSDIHSSILQCSRCFLTVHARCYGVPSSPDNPSLAASSRGLGADVPSGNLSSSPRWVCDGCRAPVKPTCAFCYMRGGAMKTLANRVNYFTKRPYWAHIVCALATPGCQFIDIEKRVASVSSDAIKCALAISADVSGVGGGGRLMTSSPVSKRCYTHCLSSECLPGPSSQCFPTESDEEHSPSFGKRACLSTPTYLEDLLFDTNFIPVAPKRHERTEPSKGSRGKCVRNRKCSTLRRNHSGPKATTKTNLNSSLNSSTSSTSDESSLRRELDRIYSECAICRLPGRGYLPLARCWFDECPKRYHVTCAQMAGVLIGTGAYPNMFYIACDQHPTGHKQHGQTDQEVVLPGDEVMVRQATNPPVFVPGIATRLVTPLYCRITFPDGTFSKDTPPEYLTNVNWIRDGPPAIGSIVKVLWDDNIEYVGNFQGTTTEKWEVQIGDDEFMVLAREDFYLSRGRENRRRDRVIRGRLIMEGNFPTDSDEVTTE